jgi:hypothetical protein
MDDDGANGSLASRVSFLTPIAGDYYIRIVNKNCASAGGYALLLEDSGAGLGWYPYP